VDFTALDHYGRKAGFDFVNLLPQSLYLVQSGLLDFISFAGSDLERSSIKSLIVPEGALVQIFMCLFNPKLWLFLTILYTRSHPQKHIWSS